MSSLFVLDTSAVLCLAYGERGADRVEAVLPQARISAVNYAETVSKLVEQSRYDEGAQADLAALQLVIVPLDRETAELAGLMRAETRGAGLSLGDRCCLALAKRLGAIALTADRAWAKVAIGVPIELVR